MKTLNLVLVSLVLLAVPSFAATARKCPPNCKHRAASACVAPHKAAATSNTAPTLASQLLSGLELAAGFRWQTERACPVITRPEPGPLEVGDPFYLGIGLRVPLSSWVDLHGRWDRDFVAEPDWQIRAEVVAMPWRKP